jgi:hypothetical protein
MDIGLEDFPPSVSAERFARPPVEFDGCLNSKTCCLETQIEPAGAGV